MAGQRISESYFVKDNNIFSETIVFSLRKLD